MWGARSMLSEDVGFYEEMVETATRLAHDSGLVEPCDTIVVVAGIPFGQSGATNNLRVVRLG
ncbi:Pyruvate kinase [compost metagenome]